MLNTAKKPQRSNIMMFQRPTRSCRGFVLLINCHPGLLSVDLTFNLEIKQRALSQMGRNLSARGEVMRNATELRCFRHFHKIVVTSNISLEFGSPQKRSSSSQFLVPSSGGLLDAHDKYNLRAGMLAAMKGTDNEEVKLAGKESPELWSQLNSHKKMMKKCMIGTATKKVRICHATSPENYKNVTPISQRASTRN